jgi:Arc/MetJ-type ribon-helix-helix transcriptional regulator
MRKTSVYLTKDEAEGLRQLAVREGRSQAELIREGVRRVITEAATPRRFRSRAVGRGGGRRPPEWSVDELYHEVMGRPPSNERP